MTINNEVVDIEKCIIPTLRGVGFSSIMSEIQKMKLSYSLEESDIQAIQDKNIKKYNLYEITGRAAIEGILLKNGRSKLDVVRGYSYDSLMYYARSGNPIDNSKIFTFSNDEEIDIYVFNPPNGF